ncbi:MAG: peptidoglycan-binding protein [Bryobacteraceae bacterium]|jgi:hypothetical protein
MRTILCWAGIAALAALGWSADTTVPPKKTTAPKKTVAKSAASAQKKAPAKTGANKSTASPTKKKSVASKTGVSKAAAGSRTTTSHPGTSKAGPRTAAARRGKRGPAKRVTWRNRQLAPTPQRYKEIQEALAAKGYLKPEDANGVWTPASMDALKKFQAGQNLESTGKINSLSLIALGLGPKRETATPKPPAEGTPAPSPSRQ